MRPAITEFVKTVTHCTVYIVTLHANLENTLPLNCRVRSHKCVLTALWGNIPIRQTKQNVSHVILENTPRVLITQLALKRQIAV